MSLFDMLDEGEELETNAKKEPKKAKVKEKKKEVPAKKAVANEKQYKYPFRMYFDHHEIDITHVFEEDKTYSTSEISNLMLRHGFYDFSGNASYDFIEEDRMLVVSFQKHSKG